MLADGCAANSRLPVDAVEACALDGIDAEQREFLLAGLTRIADRDTVDASLPPERQCPTVCRVTMDH
jgi:hypothetical protein